MVGSLKVSLFKALQKVRTPLDFQKFLNEIINIALYCGYLLIFWTENGGSMFLQKGTSPHGVTAQRTNVDIFIALRNVCIDFVKWLQWLCKV